MNLGMRVAGLIDEILAKTIPGDADAQQRTLELSVAFKRQDQWLALTRLVVSTEDQDGAYMEDQIIVFTTDEAGRDLIDVTTAGIDSNDLAAPILIRPGQTFRATWPLADHARTIALRIQGAIIHPPDLAGA